MSKGKKQSTWNVIFEGILFSGTFYLGAAMLLALLLVKGVLEESAIQPIIFILCFLSSFIGGLMVAHRMKWGTILNAVLFDGLLILIAFASEQRIVWNGKGGGLLLCGLCGGVLASISKMRGIQRRKKKVKMR